MLFPNVSRVLNSVFWISKILPTISRVLTCVFWISKILPTISKVLNYVFFVYIRYLLFYPGYYIPYLFKDFCNFIQDTSRLFKMFIFVSNLLISVSGTSKMLLLYLEDSDKLKFVFSSEKFLPRPCSIFW